MDMAGAAISEVTADLIRAGLITRQASGSA